jgi:hypothetical protein
LMPLYYALGITISTSWRYIATLIVYYAGYVTAFLSTITVVGWVIAAAGAWYISNQAGSISSALGSDLFRRRGIDITAGWWWGLPYACFSAR